MNRISLKWELMLLCILLVSLPTVLMGVIGYYTYQEFAEAELESRLQHQALDIRAQAADYISQNRRVLRREEALVIKRIESVALTMREVISTLPVSDYLAIQQKQGHKLLDQLKMMRINRSGHVFLLDSSLKPVWNQAFITDAADSSISDSFYSRIQAALPRLKKGEVTTIRYPWIQQGAGYVNRFTALTYAPNWNMVIGVTINETDYRSSDLEGKLQTEFKQRLSEQSIGERGYIWVLNSEGRYILSRDNLRNGEDMFDVVDSQGVAIVRHMISAGMKHENGTPGMIYYRWRGLGDKVPQPKAAAVTFVPEWDWIVGASANLNEFYAGLQEIRQQIVIVCVFFIISGSFLAYMFARKITQPVLHLKGLASRAAMGDLNVDVDERLISQPTEIGSLARAFALMIVSLRRLVAQKEKNGRILEQQNSELNDSQNKLELALAELELEKQKFHAQAITDPLTGLMNRRGFALSGNKEWKLFKRNEQPLTVVMIDIDHFKKINDQFGHAIGDMVLSKLSKLLSEQVRESDLIARIGGEEFAMIINLPVGLAKQGLERLRKLVEETSVSVSAEQIQFTISIGAIQAGEQYIDLNAALDAADTCLYAAKQSGRNCVVTGDE